MASDVMTLLQKQIDDERKALTDALADGCAEDYPRYREIVGKVYGLMLAYRIVGEMKVRLKQQDE